MAKAIMIQGTASNVGKTFITAGLCRIFKQDGYRVAPFKSQNMALNSFITEDGLEMGRAQVMQAEAAGIKPDARMNPILLKPTGDSVSQVIVNGKAEGNMSAREYYAYKRKLIPKISRAYESLAQEHDIIVIEGAGSPAEINLKEDDIVNMGMAFLAKAPVLLTGDIDRGGVFAALAGTMLLLTEAERSLVKGIIINKFRGDPTILEPGLRTLEELINVPLMGVVPRVKIQIDDEDSLTERFERPVRPSLVDIAVIRLPRISNFTDFIPLENIDGLSLRYVHNPRELGAPDLIILPGTKNTIGDLLWLRESGLETAILKHTRQGGAVLGICGGYQMLGKSLSDPHGVEEGGEAEGLGLLPVDTVFSREKTQTQTQGVLAEVGGIFGEFSAMAYRGYEIHMGESAVPANIINSGNIYGTYIHGLFDTGAVTDALIRALFKAKGLTPDSVKAYDAAAFKETQYELLADTLRKALDMKKIYSILHEVG